MIHKNGLIILMKKITEERCKFFDYFLKDKKNDWEETPKVRYALLDLKGGNKLNIKLMNSLLQILYIKNLFFNAITRLLINEPPLEDKLLYYSPKGLPVRTSFQIPLI